MVKTNPLLWAAVFCAVCVYCPLLSAGRRDAYASLVPLSCTRSLDCRLCASPAKSAAVPGAPYRCTAAIFRSYGRLSGGSIASDAAGSLVLSLPAPLVESLYPGRLYSEASGGGLDGGRGGFLMEDGALFRVTGRWNEAKAVFEVSRAQDLGWGTGLLSSLLYTRALARLSFKRLLAAWGRAGGLVLALLSGSREYLDPALVESFRLAGLSHILALSGMHLSFFSSLFGLSSRGFSTARLFGLPQRQCFLPALSGIGLFVFFAGLSPSLFRAFLCLFLLSLCARFCVPGADGRAVLGAVFLVHLLLRPEDAYTPAFMLSYAATAGILLLAAPCERILTPLLPPALASPLAVSAAACAATAPLSLGLFGTAAPAGVLACLVVSPLVSLFLLLSLASVAASLAVPALSPLCGVLLNVLYALIARAAGCFALLPQISV
ncbi:MAG: ComEC/Rec2 family competence protein [Treponema sp.]|nr:ComEC/Rec2 family competence protein [Treponema sp.]